MPNFIDYLLAPWKILGLLATGPQTISATGQPASSTFCSVQDLSGQLVNVCNVGGYQMPAFVFWASLMIFGIFVAAAAGLLFQCSRLALLLTMLNWKLAKLPSKELALRALNQVELQGIAGIMKKESVISHPWSHFEETLIISPQTDEIFSTLSVEEAFSKSALIEENVYGALFSAIPGILTGVGLLMTFVAILDGLSHVTVASNMDVKGIGGLINGLSGKFVSSIVAVTCAVLFVFVERIAYSRPNQAYRRLITLLSARFRRRTTEHLLFHIQAQLAQQETWQKEFAQALTQLQRRG